MKKILSLVLAVMMMLSMASFAIADSADDVVWNWQITYDENGKPVFEKQAQEIWVFFVTPGITEYKRVTCTDVTTDMVEELFAKTTTAGIGEYVLPEEYDVTIRNTEDGVPGVVINLVKKTVEMRIQCVNGSKRTWLAPVTIEAPATSKVTLDQMKANVPAGHVYLSHNRNAGYFSVKPIEYKIAFNGNGGVLPTGYKTISTSNTYAYCDKITFNDVMEENNITYTNEGYELVGWSLRYGEVALDESLTIEELLKLDSNPNDTTIYVYAIWEEIPEEDTNMDLIGGGWVEIDPEDFENGFSGSWSEGDDGWTIVIG